MQGQLNDFAKVVLGKEDYVLDKTAVDKINESAALFSSSPVLPAPEAANAPSDAAMGAGFLSPDFCRAAVFGCLQSLVQGRAGVRLAVVQLLLDMLEYEVIPCFASVDTIGLDLVQFMMGANVPCYYYKMVISTDAAFLSSGLAKIELNQHDVQVLKSGHFYFTGIAALLAVAGNSVFQMIDVVAAMSVEATGTAADAFDVAQYETYRPHRGMINSAIRLRQLVEGSQRTGCLEGPILPSLANIPAVHGPAQEFLASATKCVTFYEPSCLYLIIILRQVNLVRAAQFRFTPGPTLDKRPWACRPGL